MKEQIVVFPGENRKMKKYTPEYVLDIRKKKNDINKTEVINSAINEIFEENGIKEVPIDVKKIAKSLGFDIFYGTFKRENVYGAVWDGDEELEIGSEKSKRFILVNAKDSPERQAFTIAHELGHFMIHVSEQANFYERYHGDDGQTLEQKRCEDEADFFAANLLLPSFILLRYVMNNRELGKDQLTKKICDDFFVEEATVNKRYEELGLMLG